MHGLNFALGGLAVLSTVLFGWQWLAASRFPLHQKIRHADFAPPLSILKPLKGCDATTRDSLQTWFEQDYKGPVQILFGVAEEKDPVCEVVRALQRSHPEVDASLMVCPLDDSPNAKAAKLARLVKKASHDFVLVSDADVRVPGDFLTQFVQPLQHEKVGMVHCLYRLANPANWAMRCEALAVNVDFWSQVLQARMLGQTKFALGAAMLVRRNVLDQIGGFAGLTRFLADDYQLGNRVGAHGREVALSNMVVECWDAPMTWRQVWNHQVRWARTIRISQPAPYFFSLLSNASLWPFLFLLHTILAGAPISCLALAAILLAARIAIALRLQTLFIPGKNPLPDAAWVPVKDLLQTLVWLAAFCGNTVEWRGRKMRIQRDGTLESGGR